MNRRGFSLVELLGTITILGILMLIGVPAVYKYLTKSQNQAYDTLQKTCYEAAQSMAIKEGLDLQTVNSSTTYYIKDLADYGYMDIPADPRKKGSVCTGNVKITLTSTGSNTGMPSYTYLVTLKCPSNNNVATYKTFTSDNDGMN